MPTLDWLNRDAAFRQLDEVPYRLLELVSEHRSNSQIQLSSETANTLGLEIENDKKSINKENIDQALLNLGDTDKLVEKTTLPVTHDNLLIQGDNLEALKALLPFYRGQIKCIFIDPPYNTKSAFQHYDDNLEHAQWLSMMLPRLQLLRELLAEDGSIWVTIDDNEGHYLKVLMDEVFGRGNFVANVVWQKKYAVANDHKSIAPMHDHMLVYRLSQSWQRNLLERSDSKDSQYKFEDARGTYRVSDYTCSKTAEERPNLYYAVTNPNTGEQIWPKRTRVWAYSQDQYEKHANDSFIFWGKDGRGKVPGYKRYLHLLKQSGIVPQTLWEHTFAGHTDAARKEAREVLGTTDLGDDFLTPKPELLISRIVEIATNPNDLILDSFLGSGTTAAVAQKMGRRWIGIEMGDHAHTHCVPRLQKVIDGEQGGISKTVNWQGGGSFRFMKLGATVFDETGAIHPDVRFATLAAFIWMQETHVPLPKKKTGSSPFLGTHNGIDYFLLFNGILGDKRPNAGNVLTRAVLQELTLRYPNHGRLRVIYGESNRLGADRLDNARVQFKTLPHEVVKR